MGKSRNKNRNLSKTDKVYAKKARNKLKKQNAKKTGAAHLLAKVAAANKTKNHLQGLKPTESRRSFRKRLAKFKANKLKERKKQNVDTVTDVSEPSATGSQQSVVNAEPTVTLGPRNSSFSTLKKEYAALSRRLEAGVPTHRKQFNGMLKLCAAIGEYHLAVFVLGQMSAQDLDPDEEAFTFLKLLQEKKPTNSTYIEGVTLNEALGGIHPKVIIKQLLQKHKLDAMHTSLQDEVSKVKIWLKQNVEICNEKGTRCRKNHLFKKKVTLSL